MNMLTGTKAADRLDGIVHEDTQVGTIGVDLTVGEVHALTGPGSLDFGGSEEEPARREELFPEKSSPDDDYSWWHLAAGFYLVIYNETPRLEDGEVGRIESLPRLLAAGAGHAAWTTDGTERRLASLLTVGPAGCRLKENCRISRWVVLAP